LSISYIFNLPFFHIFQILSLFSSIFSLSFHYCEKIWKIQKKSKLNSEKIWKIQKKIVKRYGNYGRNASRVVKRYFPYPLTLFFCIFQIFSLFNLGFFHIFHIISQFSSVFPLSFYYFLLYFNDMEHMEER
jgi:uncharacterized membrane protein